MECKKYEFTGETMDFFGHTLQRIRAIRDSAGIKVGDIGGWIENEENLTHSGDAWVCGDAWVYGDAQVYGDARVCNQRNIFWKDNIGSRKDTTTFFLCQNNEIRVSCGCFSGTVKEFETAVKKTRGNNQHAIDYFDLISMARIWIKSGDFKDETKTVE